MIVWWSETCKCDKYLKNKQKKEIRKGSNTFSQQCEPVQFKVKTCKTFLQINATEIGCCLISSNTLCHSCSRACCIVWRPIRVTLTSEQQRLTLPWPAETLWCAGSSCNSLQQKRQPQHQRCFLCKEQENLQNSKCRQMQVELLCSFVFSHTYNVLCYDGKSFR